MRRDNFMEGSQEFGSGGAATPGRKRPARTALVSLSTFRVVVKRWRVFTQPDQYLFQPRNETGT